MEQLLADVLMELQGEDLEEPQQLCTDADQVSTHWLRSCLPSPHDVHLVLLAAQPYVCRGLEACSLSTHPCTRQIDLQHVCCQ